MAADGRRPGLTWPVVRAGTVWSGVKRADDAISAMTSCEASREVGLGRPPLVADLVAFHRAALPALAAIQQAGRLGASGSYEFPGQFRRSGIAIRASVHQPPPPELVEAEIAALFDALCLGWESHETAYLAGLALWRVNWIHPFREGNGRSARALCRWIVSQRSGERLGRAFEGTLTADRAAYYAALADADAAFARRPTLGAGADAMRAFIAPIVEAALHAPRQVRQGRSIRRIASSGN